jgi:hypothetical protein
MGLMRRKAEHIDFGFLAAAIKSNPRAVPSNVDAMMERRGRFLAMEFKKPNEEFGEGQKIFLRALAKKPDTTVWIVTGHFDREPVEFDSAHILLPSSRLRLLTDEFEKLVEALNIWHDAPEVYRELYETDRKEPT